MRLLVVTQIVDYNHSVLGFFHDWLSHFALHTTSLEVICLSQGAHTLPGVQIHSLGKERGKRNRVVYGLRFIWLAWKLRNKYDAVFVHMNSEYILLAGLLWRFLGKRVGLWYVHRSTPWHLRLAVYISHCVFTASRTSFRLRTRKLRVVGHGITTERLKNVKRHVGPEIKIITIGRISATKRIREMISVIQELTRRGFRCSFTVVGSSITNDDREYEKDLSRELEQSPIRNMVHFVGAIAHTSVPRMLGDQSVFINLSLTESLDKAVLEALAAGIPVVTSNPAFRELLLPYGLYIRDVAPDKLASAVLRAEHTDTYELVKTIRREHSLSQLIPSILEKLEYD